MVNDVLRITIVGEGTENSQRFMQNFTPIFKMERPMFGMQYYLFDSQQYPDNPLHRYKNVFFRLDDIQCFIPCYRTYIRITNGCVILFNLHNRESFERVQFWITHIRGINPECPIIMIGNMTSEDFTREISIKECLELAVASNVYYLDNALLTNQEILFTFDLILARQSLEPDLCMKIRDSFHSSPMELTLRIIRGETLSPEELHLLCHFGGFKERTLLEAKFPLENEILTELNQKIAVPLPLCSIFL